MKKESYYKKQAKKHKAQLEKDGFKVDENGKIDNYSTQFIIKERV